MGLEDQDSAVFVDGMPSWYLGKNFIHLLYFLHALGSTIFLDVIAQRLHLIGGIHGLCSASLEGMLASLDGGKPFNTKICLFIRVMLLF